MPEVLESCSTIFDLSGRQVSLLDEDFDWYLKYFSATDLVFEPMKSHTIGVSIWSKGWSMIKNHLLSLAINMIDHVSTLERSTLGCDKKYFQKSFLDEPTQPLVELTRSVFWASQLDPCSSWLVPTKRIVRLFYVLVEPTRFLLESTHLCSTRKPWTEFLESFFEKVLT